MNRFAILLVALLLLVAATAPAQQPPEGYIHGKTFLVTTALDTLHSTLTKASGVAAAKWQGPKVIPISTKSNGDFVTVKALPVGWFVYARKPFQWRGLDLAGSLTNSVYTLADTMTTTTNYFRNIFPCTALIMQPLQQLRVKPASSDTVCAVPIFKIPTTQ